MSEAPAASARLRDLATVAEFNPCEMPPRPRPGPWFSGAHLTTESEELSWSSVALSSCDSSACTLCHRSRHSTGLTSPPLSGRLRRSLVRLGRPLSHTLPDAGGESWDSGPTSPKHHLVQRGKDGAAGRPSWASLQGRSTSLISGSASRKRAALSPIRERQGVSRAAVGDSHQAFSPLLGSGSLLQPRSLEKCEGEDVMRRCMSLTREMTFSKRARTSGRSSFDSGNGWGEVQLSHLAASSETWAGNGGRPGRASFDFGSRVQDVPRVGRSSFDGSSSLSFRGGCVGWHARPHWCEQAAPAQLTRVSTARPSKPGAKGAADVVRGLEFSPDGMLLASVGASKSLHVYSLDAAEGAEEPVTFVSAHPHRLPGRLTAIAWNPWHEGVVTVGDYDGAVMQVHVHSGHLLVELEEHSSGRSSSRSVLSVAHSRARRNLVATTGDDGTARLWAGYAMSQAAGIITNPSGAAITSADFSPHDENLLALASCDAHAYLYDLRWPTHALKVVDGHGGSVSYVKFMGSQRLITSSVDATVACWDIGASFASPRTLTAPTMRFSGHVNQKKFVGLSVLAEEGLIASGSEDCRAFAYHMSKATPLTSLELGAGPHSSGKDFVGAVCWQPRTPATAAAFGTSPVMAVALSENDIRLLRLDVL